MPVRRALAPARVAVLFGVGCLAPFGALAGVVPAAAAAIAVTCFVAMLAQAWGDEYGFVMRGLDSGSGGGVGRNDGLAGSLVGAFFAQILGMVIQHFG